MKTTKQILISSIGDVTPKGNVTIGCTVRKGFGKKRVCIFSDEDGISDLVEALKVDDPSKLIGMDIADLCEGWQENPSTFVGEDDGLEHTTIWLQP